MGETRGLKLPGNRKTSPAKNHSQERPSRFPPQCSRDQGTSPGNINSSGSSVGLFSFFSQSSGEEGRKEKTNRQHHIAPGACAR